MQRKVDRLKRFDSRWVRALAAGVVMGTLVLGGCASVGERVLRTKLTEQDIVRHGTATFDGTPGGVFRACSIAVQMAGYRISVANADTGLIVTAQKERTDHEPQGQRHYFGYVLELKQLSGGKVQVTAIPTASNGLDAPPDGGAEPFAWDLGHERAAWTRLFGDVRTVLEREREKHD